MSLFFEKFQTPHETVPFDQVKLEQFVPDTKKAIELAKQRIEELKKVTAPTFKDFMVPFMDASKELDIITSTFFNLNSANTNDEMEKIAQELSPILSAFQNDIALDEELFKAIRTIYENRSSEGLNTEELTIIEKEYKSFTRNGANLKDEDKATLREIDEKLSKTGLLFGQNSLKANNAFHLELKDDDLAGLPESFVEASKQAAKEKDIDGYVVTFDYPIYVPFMMYAKKRELRQKVYEAFVVKAVDGEFSNQQNCLDLLKLREQRAQLLGYKNHAHYVLENRMAETPERVMQFLKDITGKALAKAKAEVKEVENFAKKIDGIDHLEAWDFSYYAEKLKKEKFNFDDEDLRPYLKLENCIEGAFTVASKLYQINFKKNTDIPVYHEDVVAYEVYDNKTNELRGIFYADFFPRPAKRQGAWMTSYKDQSNEQIPHVSIVCNFSKSTETKPSLLTFNELTTLFHEFGHSLHGLLSKCQYSYASGTHVLWDFVELPSQITENWCYEKECLDIFAKHYETGELIPAELVEKIREARKFNEGYATLRQNSFATLDMTLHQKPANEITDIVAEEKAIMEEFNLFPSTVERKSMCCTFSHIFAGGYSAGYYSYKWAEVLDADAFEEFEKHGIFDETVAAKFKENILQRGGSEHPMELYKKFKGREPSINALINRAGLN